MKILGIETSCDDTAVGIVEDGRNIISNILAIKIAENILKWIPKNTHDYKKLISILDSHKPDIIINASGVFGDNSIDFKSVFDVNIRSNWEIIKIISKHIIIY